MKSGAPCVDGVTKLTQAPRRLLISAETARPESFPPESAGNGGGQHPGSSWVQLCPTHAQHAHASGLPEPGAARARHCARDHRDFIFLLLRRSPAPPRDWAKVRRRTRGSRVLFQHLEAGFLPPRFLESHRVAPRGHQRGVPDPRSAQRGGRILPPRAYPSEDRPGPESIRPYRFVFQKLKTAEELESTGVRI